MCRLLVGLPDVTVLGVDDPGPGVPLVVTVETDIGDRPPCRECGVRAGAKDRDDVSLVDLPAFGRPVCLVWRKRRWRCNESLCEATSWTEHVPSIAWARHRMSDRAGRWATWHVGGLGRSVQEVAEELGTDWHTVMDAVLSYGLSLVDHPDRFADVAAVGLDETQFTKTGPFKIKQWSTSIVDVQQSTLLDVIEGREWAPAARWFHDQGEAWRQGVRWATLDLSGSYRKAFDIGLPDAVQVADPFHVVRLANECVEDTRRRVQQDTLGHRGRKHDPLWRARKLLVIASEKLDEQRHDKRRGLLAAGDPRGEVATAYLAKESIREFYGFRDPLLADRWVDELVEDMTDVDAPPEVRKLGRTLRRWKSQLVAWHTAGVSNGPTESMNNLCKRVKRVAFGMTNFRNWRVRCLLYAGRPDWDLLPTIIPAVP